MKRGITPDIVTDQTSSHDLLSYIPEGNLKYLDSLRVSDPAEYKLKAQIAIVKHVSAILEMQKRGAVCFDYGNNLRGQAEKVGLAVRDEQGNFLYPGFVQAYIRPLFSEGKGPFRWVALSGDPADILRIDKALLETFPHDTTLHR